MIHIDVVLSFHSMKSVIDRYGRAKEDQQLVANPNTELKVCQCIDWFSADFCVP
jgi:hypothetical protein